MKFEDDVSDLDEKSAQDESEAVQEQEFYGLPRGLETPEDSRTSSHIWLISYSDFMTILMIFFLAMYGYTYLAKAQLLKQANDPRIKDEFQKTVLEMKANLGDQLKVQEGDDKVVLQFGEEILFRSGSAKLASQARLAIEQLAKSVMLAEGMVVVEGHTDNVPIKSAQFPSNWELSAARAFSVIEALTDAGVPAERLSAWGFGDSRPQGANDTAEQRAKNRRIEVVLVNKGTSKETENGG